MISFEFLNLGEIKNSELTGSGRCTVQSGVSWKKSLPEPSRERTFNAVQRNRAAKKRRQSRPNPFTGSAWLCTALGSLLRTNLILSACSIKSRFLYSVYLFCLGFPESRRQTARLTLILRSQKKQDPGLDNPSFFRQYISQKTTILSHEKLWTSSMILSVHVQKIFSGVKNVQCQQHAQ